MTHSFVLPKKTSRGNLSHTAFNLSQYLLGSRAGMFPQASTRSLVRHIGMSSHTAIGTEYIPDEAGFEQN